ncbi:MULTISPECIES: hypothetical protein [Mesonia]|uniref:Uncharacterized protein n=1 Tax=Mesonia oceanica TaxID=2687242 RepID=A0AC61Y5Z6_9FLAO|nr:MULTISPECIES: hypothetical protein [Mesonia]MAN28312.1 hypothetical protein [Mesonia sp.]MAQ39740.1 hypothetical protein [Mesonia sp.]VVU99864.1 hypothetical protein FVB9532_01125 [Mesonia oceanica]|tara:strand:- start:5002 stop:5607 length:606 start_codon:yes stop_codon:yes gene_type:complete
MKEFYILNKNKIPKAFKFLSITGLVFVSLILLISLFNNKLPNKILIVQIYITAGILFPIFGLVVAYLDWESRNLLKRKKFNNTPLNQLEKIGFTDSYLNEKNKWFFTEKIKKGIIKNYIIEINIKRENSKFIEFSHNIDMHLNNHSTIIRSLDHLESKNILFENGRIVKKIRIKKLNSISEIEQQLIDFTKELKNNELIAN